MSSAVTVYAQPTNEVDARELYERLGMGWDFNTWIKYNISRLQLDEGIDFRVYPENRVNPQGGRPRDVYILTFAAAKLIAISARAEGSLEAKKYLLKLEEAWQTPEMVFAHALRLANDMIEKQKARVAESVETIKALTPKAEMADRFLSADGLIRWSDGCAHLGISEKAAAKFAIDKGILYREPARKNHIGKLRPSKQYIYAGYFKFPLRENHDDKKYYRQTFFTHAGLAWFAQQWDSQPKGAKQEPEPAVENEKWAESLRATAFASGIVKRSYGW
jgi:anti-repressor protein